MIKGAVFSEAHRANIAAARRGTKASEETKAKMRASQALRGPRSEEHKAKISAALLGKPKSDAARQAMSLAKKGKFVRLMSEANKLAILNAVKGSTWSSHQRAKLSGANSPHWGKPPRHKARIPYRGVLMRSSWEVRFAQACDAQNIDWVYEPVRFDLGIATYTPDFLLPETGALWEVKGWLDSASQCKISAFRELYPEVPLVVASGPVLRQFETVALRA